MRRIFKALLNPRLVIDHIKLSLVEFRERSWVRSDIKSINIKDKVLFVDLGANIGQGYQWFKYYYDKRNVEFELFEPNPYCFEEISKLPEAVSGDIKLHNAGVGTTAGSFKFYGLADDEGGRLSQGGSILKEHASDWYDVKEESAIIVDVIDFSKYLYTKAKEFDKVVVKMDIEGAEVDLLEGLIKDRMIEKIDILYVEFHSQYQKPDQSLITKKREIEILNSLSKISKLKVHIWH